MSLKNKKAMHGKSIKSPVSKQQARKAKEQLNRSPLNTENVHPSIVAAAEVIQNRHKPWPELLKLGWKYRSMALGPSMYFCPGVKKNEGKLHYSKFSDLGHIQDKMDQIDGGTPSDEDEEDESSEFSDQEEVEEEDDDAEEDEDENENEDISSSSEEEDDDEDDEEEELVADSDQIIWESIEWGSFQSSSKPPPCLLEIMNNNNNNNNNSSSSSSSSSSTTEKDSTDIQWGDLRKLGWKWSNDHNGLGNYFYRPGISTKIQKASAVENIDVFKDISDIRSMIQIHNIKNQLLNNQDYLNRYVNYHIQNAVLLINQELDTNAHLSDLQLWNCLASKKGYVENPKVEM